MTYDQWWDETYANTFTDGDANYTFGEEVWQVAQREVWNTVFQIVSDNAQMAERRFIKKLEAARAEAGFDPVSVLTTSESVSDATMAHDPSG